MIFVTVGSQKFPFDRLIKKVDQMVREQLLAEEVCIQTGTSRYVPACRHQAFCEPELFAQWMEDCTVLITHGGAGTMVDAVKRGKKTIVVPRLARYGEHVDDHQLELTQRLHQLKLIRACPDGKLLPQALLDLREQSFEPFRSNTEVFLASLDRCIRSL